MERLGSRILKCCPWWISCWCQQLFWISTGGTVTECGCWAITEATMDNTEYFHILSTFSAQKYKRRFCLLHSCVIHRVSQICSFHRTSHSPGSALTHTTRSASEKHCLSSLDFSLCRWWLNECCDSEDCWDLLLWALWECSELLQLF